MSKSLAFHASDRAASRADAGALSQGLASVAVSGLMFCGVLVGVLAVCCALSAAGLA